MEIIIFTDLNNCYGFGRDTGAYRISTELRENGFTVQVIDFFASMSWADINSIANKFVDDSTFMVAFSTTHFASNQQVIGTDHIKSFVDRANVYNKCDCFPQSDSWIRDIQITFLNYNPKIKFVVGGEKVATTNKDRYKIDHWVLGNAEKSIVELANALRNNKTMPKVIHSNRDYNYESFNISKVIWTNNDIVFPGEHLPIEVSRGCSFNCPFCSYRKKGKNDLVKDLDVLKDELMYNYETFDTTGYMIMDPTFNDSIDKVERFCNLFKSMPFQMEWSGFARLDVFSKYPEMREMLLESGAKSIQFGIETLNDKTINIIKKGISSEKTKDLLYFLNEKWNKNIITGSFFILGLPEETEKDIYKNMEWLFEDDCPLHSVDLGILTIRKYIENIKEEIAYSLFSRDYEKYGYTSPGNWTNIKTGLTRNRCFEILYDLSNKNMSRKTIDFYFYSRMRNLGYTFDELWDMKKDYGESFVESNERRQILMEKYMRQLMSL